jgi:hypothetical protein
MHGFVFCIFQLAFLAELAIVVAQVGLADEGNILFMA